MKIPNPNSVKKKELPHRPADQNLNEAIIIPPIGDRGSYSIHTPHGYLDVDFDGYEFYIAYVFVEEESRRMREGWQLLDCAYRLAVQLKARRITAMFVGEKGQALFENYFGGGGYTYKDGPSKSFELILPEQIQQ